MFHLRTTSASAADFETHTNNASDALAAAGTAVKNTPLGGLPQLAGVFDGITAATGQASAIFAVRDKALTEVRGGITGSKHGWITAMVISGVAFGVMLAVWGVDIYKLVQTVKEGGAAAAAGSSVAIQVVALGCIIVATVVGKMHSIYAKREARLRKIAEAANAKNALMTAWANSAKDVIDSVTNHPGDFGTQATRLKDCGKAWKNLPAEERDKIPIDLFKEHALAALPVNNPLRQQYEVLKGRAVAVRGLRVQFEQNHQDLLRKDHVDVEALIADLTQGQNYNEQQIAAIRERAQPFLNARSELNIAALAMVGKIGRIKDFQVDAEWRCKLPWCYLYRPPPPAPVQPVVNGGADGNGGFVVEMNNLANIGNNGNN